MGQPKRKAGRKGKALTRVAFRRNRSRPARIKRWDRLVDDPAGGVEDAPTSERVVAKGDLSRQRTVVDSGGNEATANLRDGTVVALRGLFAEVDDGQRVWPCTIRRVLRTLRIDHRSLVAIGDAVRFRVVADRDGVEAEGVIQSVAARRSEMRRLVRRRMHTIVANVDQVLIIVATAEPAPNPRLVDRYLVAAHAGRIAPVVCINKIDLPAAVDLEEFTARYRRLGYPVLRTSAQTGVGVDELRALLAGRSSAVVGPSGAGKSSLLNAVEPGLNQRVGAVSEATSKGRHTTTTAKLIRLATGGYVVDTPGAKAFGIAGISPGELEAYFPEIAERVADCRFPGCLHLKEAGCAIRAAAESGAIHAERYDSYVRMFTELRGGR